MTDDRALLAAIRAAPADDAPRLVYADWLDEHAQPERAEFIRVQCELARRDDPGLHRREAELLAAHHDALAGPLAAPHLRFRFEGGLPVAFGHTGYFTARDPQSRQTGTDLRFFPDGLVQYASDVSDLIDFDPEFATRHWDTPWPTTAYGFWVLGDHVELDFDFSDGFIPCSFRGWLWSAGLCLERTEYAFDPRTLLQDFTHVPLPGLNSFPET